MEQFLKLIEHYKSIIPMGKVNGWDMIHKFAEVLYNKNLLSEEAVWEMMKDFHEELIGKHFTEPYALHQVSKMYHTNHKGLKIDEPMFSMETAKHIYDKNIRNLSKDITPCDVYVALNAQYHDNINLYKKWFPDATEDEIEQVIVEATINDWFLDEDAGDSKVWNYFKVIG